MGPSHYISSELWVYSLNSALHVLTPNISIFLPFTMKTNLDCEVYKECHKKLAQIVIMDIFPCGTLNLMLL